MSALLRPAGPDETVYVTAASSAHFATAPQRCEAEHAYYSADFPNDGSPAVLGALRAIDSRTGHPCGEWNARFTTWSGVLSTPADCVYGRAENYRVWKETERKKRCGISSAAPALLLADDVLGRGKQ